MKYRRFFRILTVLAITSCNDNSIVPGAHVSVSKPAESITLCRDTLPSGLFKEVLECQDITISHDTVLVLQDGNTSENNCHYKAYSTGSLEYLGQFIHKGNGPGEMISPYHVLYNTTDDMFVSDSGTIRSVDPVGSSLNNGLSGVRIISLPEDAFDYMPLTTTRSLISSYQERKMSYQLYDNDSKAVCPIKVFDDSSLGAVTFLSTINTSNINHGKAAMFMLCLPQVVFISGDGGIHSVAVDKKFKQWKTLFSQMLGPESIQYYVGVTSDRNYIYAAYAGTKVGSMNDGSCGTSIQIFDWDGDYLYEIKVKESVDCPAIDSRSHYLYCRNRSDHSIVRYDLSGLKLNM